MSGLSILLSLQLACCVGLLIWQARVFARRESEWRERERVLIDRLLKQAHVAPLVIEREQVVKLPDVEASQPRDPWGDAFRLDAIKEELEQLHPEVANMPPEQARLFYPQEWMIFEAEWERRNAPLKVS